MQTIAAIPFASSTRRDLLLEVLALRHQLGVLARANRRFRSADRLLWVILRRLWPRWRDALKLVQPATVDRWHRDGFSRWWPHRTRRPGRPRIDAECRHLIHQMAAENRLWGAPRIHGELVKLGIAVSERTVSRYVRECPRGASQTWRTFLANHYGQLTFISPESPAQGANDVVNGDNLTFRHTPFLPNPSYRSHQRAVVACDASLRQTWSAKHLVHNYLHDRPIRTSSARSPPGTGPSLARSTANAKSIDGSERYRSANDHAGALARARRNEIASRDDDLTRRHSGSIGTSGVEILTPDGILAKHSRTGRIGDQAAPDLLAEAAEGLDRPVYYLCGAPGFVEAAFRSLVSSGVEEADTRFEVFRGYGVSA